MPLGARPLKPFPNASSAPTNWEQGSRLRATEANYLKSFVISRLINIIGNNVIISTCYEWSACFHGGTRKTCRVAS